MRLWHKDLIEVLPRQQLVSQWRECCAIAGSIAKKGTPNHILVNKVLSSSGDFFYYTQKILSEFENRNYKVSEKSLKNFHHNFSIAKKHFEEHSTHFNIYPNWHNDRYLKQCLFNLQEKYDCGGISEEEWCRIAERFSEYL